MTDDIGTSSRKRLTPRQRLTLWEDHRGICVICGLPIRAGEPWQDEHCRALGLGGSNSLTNRGPAHKRCSKAKDRDDISRIAKAKRQKCAALGIKDEKRARIPAKEKEPKEPLKVAAGQPEIMRRFR
jgi:5-methylcytosine-specific restriction protein A